MTFFHSIGKREAHRSIAQLNASQSNEFVALLNEWVLKMRQVRLIFTLMVFLFKFISNSFLFLFSAVIRDTTKLVKSIPTITVGSPPGKEEAGHSEDMIHSLDYVAELTRSKVVEVLIKGGRKEKGMGIF